jgi:hypothetical protein
MKWLCGALLAALFAVGWSARAEAADDKDVKPILDKAIKPLGGEEKLGKVKAAAWKTKGKITFNGNESEFTTSATVKGLDHFRSTFEGEFGGNKVKAVAVLAKNKGWRQFGDNKMEMDEDGVANEKRTVYLQVIPILLVPLRDNSFKVEAAGDKKIGDKPAVGLKVTGPDRKSFTLYFDKESGLPVLLTAKVVGFNGEEFTQETSFADYKDFAGVKKATKITTKRDGETFLEANITEFKTLEKVDDKTFAEP